MGTAVVFVGGPVEGHHPPERALEGVRADLVVAADSGLDLALALQWPVDLVVGDMDSVSAEALERTRDAGAEVRDHPTDKDATDLELAMEAVCGAAEVRRIDRVVVVGSSAGRMDHLLGAALTLGSPSWRGVTVDAWFGGASLHPIHDRRELHGTSGEVVSLLPLHGAAVGVRTRGLRWPLAGDTLAQGSSRGISNEFVGGRAEVTVERGCLLAVVPEGDRSAA